MTRCILPRICAVDKGPLLCRSFSSLAIDSSPAPFGSSGCGSPGFISSPATNPAFEFNQVLVQIQLRSGTDCTDKVRCFGWGSPGFSLLPATNPSFEFRQCSLHIRPMDTSGSSSCGLHEAIFTPTAIPLFKLNHCCLLIVAINCTDCIKQQCKVQGKVQGAR